MNLTFPQLETTSGPVLPRSLLDAAPDWEAFCSRLSDDTENYLAPLWWNNVKANAPLIRRKGSAYDRYRGQGQNKACVIVGASPALKNNWEALKAIQNDPNFIIIAVASSLKFLLSKGIRPKFVVAVDGAVNCVPKLDVGGQAQGITLIATCIVHPTTFKVWKGNTRFLRVGISDKYEKEYARLTKIKDMFPGAGTGYNTSVLFAYMILQSRILLFVGNELSYEEQYYADRKDEKDKVFEKYAWINIHGGMSFTNHNFIQSKIWLEHQLGQWKGVFINATEAGILGTSKRFGSLDYILQMRLANSIDYVKKALEQYKKEVH